MWKTGAYTKYCLGPGRQSHIGATFGGRKVEKITTEPGSPMVEGNQKSDTEDYRDTANDCLRVR